MDFFKLQDLGIKWKEMAALMERKEINCVPWESFVFDKLFLKKYFCLHESGMSLLI